MHSIVELASRKEGREACSKCSAGKVRTVDDASDKVQKRNICCKKLWEESGDISGELTPPTSLQHI